MKWWTPSKLDDVCILLLLNWFDNIVKVKENKIAEIIRSELLWSRIYNRLQ